MIQRTIRFFAGESHRPQTISVDQQSLQQNMQSITSENPDSMVFVKAKQKARVSQAQFEQYQNLISSHMFPQERWVSSAFNPEKPIEGLDPERAKKLKLHDTPTQSPETSQAEIHRSNARDSRILPPVRKVRRIIDKHRLLDDKEEKIIYNYINSSIASKVIPSKHSLNPSRNRRHISVVELLKSKQKKHSRNHHVHTVEAIQLPSSYEQEKPQKRYMRRKDFNGRLLGKSQGHEDLQPRNKSMVLTQAPQVQEYEISRTQQYNFFNLATQFSKETEKESFAEGEFLKADKRQRRKMSIPDLPNAVNIESFISNYSMRNEQINKKQLINSNFFSIESAEGELYFGEMVGKKRSGKGVLLTEHALFEGEWKNHSKIRGVQLSQSGVYKGDFVDNVKSGNGEFEWCNGDYYVGEWQKGKRHGNGLWVNSRSDSYNGSWKNGMADGYGVLTYRNRKYKGQFLAFQRNGWGREMFENGDTFAGIYRDNHPHGKGVYRWKNGTVYEGQFCEGLRHGKGVLKSPFNLSYSGDFNNDSPEGECRIDMPNGDYYVGGFKNGSKNGKGLMKLQNRKKILEGYWRDGRFVNSVLV